ncbi:Transposon Tf2-11 polyprotein [Araneus ventricosus]|uniref:RNA-directed DNA polymerase n=1 Tax=Araneus ventricosus TaxID=182803 RepID=A0A4Y2M3G5_ARAVE|nr:Transposon Tf2-11 polyprotein [Araneus ventricosus]
MSIENGKADGTELHKVSVKIPPFWIDKPEIWFYQVEAQFKISGITAEETKFNYLISQLDPKFVENVWDIIRSDSQTKYTDSKTRLLNLFKESENARIQRLITGINLDDLKPSQLLQKLRSVATSDVSENLIKTLWLGKLPDSIKNILIVSKEDTDSLAIMADKICDMSPKTEIYSTSYEHNSSNELLDRVKNLEQQISALFIRTAARPRTRNNNYFRNRSRSRSNRRHDFNPKGKLCYFHFRFGTKCFPEKCQPPCSWNQKPQENQENSSLQNQIFGISNYTQGSRPLPDKVQAIMNYKRPENIQDLRTFLGILNFYRRYLKDAAKNQALLHEYLKGSKKQDKRKIQWTDEAEKQFEKYKNDLANATLLSFPNSELPLSLFTDASDTAIGAVLQQYENSTWQPIAFYSKKLNDTQQNYSTYDRELLGIYLSVKHFKHYLEGRTFTIYTDHKPLIFAFYQKLDKAAPRQARQLNYISQFSTDIKYIKDENNIVADTLSRVTEVSSIDYDQITDAQTQDEELKSLQTITSLNLKEYPLPSGKYLWCGTSTSEIRPYIPQAFRKQIFHHIHGLSHPGIKSTIKLMNSKFIWPSIKKYVQLWTRTCIPCQKAKINRHTKTKLGEFEVPSGRFCVVHIDLIGPLPPSRENIYCLTCIDRFSNWMEAIPLDNISADTVARAFYSNWIARFGTPHKLITDRGTQFRSETLQTLSKICGIKLQHTTAYQPACNGKVERFHRPLKTALKAHNNLSWIDTLPTVLLGLRTAIQEDNNHSIAQIVYGESLRLPGEFFSEPSIRTASEGFANNLQKQMETVGPRITRRN